MAQYPARQNATQQIGYLRKTISYTDDGASIEIGTIPAGAEIIKPISGVSVDVAFDGNSANTLNIGTSGTANLYGSALALGTIGYIPFDEVVTQHVAVDTTIYAAVTSTASATAGSGVVVIAYLCDNEGS